MCSFENLLETVLVGTWTELNTKMVHLNKMHLVFIQKLTLKAFSKEITC